MLGYYVRVMIRIGIKPDDSVEQIALDSLLVATFAFFSDPFTRTRLYISFPSCLTIQLRDTLLQ